MLNIMTKLNEKRVFFSVYVNITITDVNNKSPRIEQVKSFTIYAF
jgi:hypothetical protein